MQASTYMKTTIINYIIWQKINVQVFSFVYKIKYKLKPQTIHNVKITRLLGLSRLQATIWKL